MIYEFSIDALVEMMRTDHYQRTVVIDGIPLDHLMVGAQINEFGNLEVITRDGDGVASTERRGITVRNLRGSSCADEG